MNVLILIFKAAFMLWLGRSVVQFLARAFHKTLARVFHFTHDELGIAHEALTAIQEDAEASGVFSAILHRLMTFILSDDAKVLTAVASLRIVRALRTATLPKGTSVTRCRALSALNLWAVLLPARIAKEDLGDYAEDINARVDAGDASLTVYARMLVAIFWTGVNSVGYFLKAIGKVKSAN